MLEICQIVMFLFPERNRSVLIERSRSLVTERSRSTTTLASASLSHRYFI